MQIHKFIAIDNCRQRLETVITAFSKGISGNTHTDVQRHFNFNSL